MLVQLILSTIPLASAEGFLATDAVMFADTTLYVDIYDSAAEEIYWYGTGLVEVYDPDGYFIGTIKPNDFIFPFSGDGTYRVEMRRDQEQWWQVTVYSYTGEQEGRVHSYDWHYDTTGTDAGQWASFYVAVPMGDRSTVSVVKAELNGLGGDDFHIRASSAGVAGHSTRSVLMKTATPPAELPLYLADPGLGVFTDSLTVGTPDYTPEGGLCEGLLSPGLISGEFSVPADLDGALQVTCDTSGDGVYDLSGYTDVIAHHGVTAKGTAIAKWDGLDADDQPLEAGPLSCQVDFLQGTVHLTVGDADTAHEGVRLFARDSSGYTESWMFWNDAVVQSGGDGLPYSYDTAKASSEPEGTTTLWPSIPAISNDNAHTWGDYTDATKGTDAWIDTWIASDSVTAGTITLEIIDPTADADADGLLDAQEECLTGTKPDSPDSDGDGLTDGDEVEDVHSPRDTDGDGEIDALDDDDDGDGILTATEISDGALYGHDIDGDGLDHWHDKDSDADGIPDADEPDDADSDGTPDYLQAAGFPDTGTPDTATPDTGAAPLTLRGQFQGGACTCGGGAPAAGWLLAPLLLLVRRRRQGQG